MQIVNRTFPAVAVIIFSLLFFTGCGSAGTSEIELPELTSSGVVCELNGGVFQADNFDFILNRVENSLELRADNAQATIRFTVNNNQQSGVYTGGEVNVAVNLADGNSWNTNTGSTVFNIATINLDNNRASGTFSETQENGTELRISRGEFLDVPVTVIE